jgi:hypothetical protein
MMRCRSRERVRRRHGGEDVVGHLASTLGQVASRNHGVVSGADEETSKVVEREEVMGTMLMIGAHA